MILAIKENGKVEFISPVPHFDESKIKDHVIIEDVPKKTESQKYDIVDGELVVLDMTKEEKEEKALEERDLYFKSIEKKLDNYVDSVAQDKGYRSGDACATYIGGNHEKYKQEARIFLDWRDSFWDTVYSISNKYATAETLPSFEDVLTELPKINWDE